METSTAFLCCSFFSSNHIFTRTYFCFTLNVITGDMTSHWRHNDHGGVSNQQPHGCLLNRLFWRRSKKSSKLRVTGLCVGNSTGPVNSPHKGPVTRKMFPFDDVIMRSQGTVSITYSSWWCKRHQHIKPEQNSWQYEGDILMSVFMGESHYILMQISLKFVLICPIDKQVSIGSWNGLAPYGRQAYEPTMIQYANTIITSLQHIKQLIISHIKEMSLNVTSVLHYAHVMDNQQVRLWYNGGQCSVTRIYHIRR